LAGLSQSGLAKALNVSRSAVAQWERPDGSTPSSTNLSNLAVELACNFDWLATGRGSRIPHSASDESAAETVVQLAHFAKDDVEEHLLTVVRELDDLDKQALITLADVLSTRSRGKRRRTR